MRDVLLIRFGEVYLKGLNRPYFLKKLVDHIKHVIRPMGGTVWLSDSRIYAAGMADMRLAQEKVCKIFGVHSVSPAVEMEKGDFDAISRQAIEMLKDKKGTFKVWARRSDKKYPMQSPEMAAELGGRILKANPNLTVDVHNPEIEINLEIRDYAYLYIEKYMAMGGMPMGTGGKGMLLLSGGIDSPVAGWQMMKRGVSLDAIHFFSFPYTGERARQKVLDLAKMVGEYGGGMRVYVVPFTDIQLEIHEKCPDEYGTLLMRRAMMRIAERIAQQAGAQCLITGESLAQVASQTMDALVSTDNVVTMPVFRPLIAFDKIETIELAQKIGTYETSILPYEDCCTVFTPRHPSTHPSLKRLEEVEKRLDPTLLDAAIANVETVLC